MEYAIFGLLIIISLFLYLVSNKLFFASILLAYPLIAQSVLKSFYLFGLELNLSKVYGGIILLACLIELIKWIITPRRDKFTSIEILIVTFLFYSAVLTLLSINRTSSIIAGMKVSTWMLLLIVSKRIFTTKKDLLMLSNLATICCFIIAISYFLSRLGIYGGQWETYAREGVTVYSAEFWGPTGIALPLVMSIPLLMINFYLDRKKILPIFIISISILIIFLTYLRSAVVILICGYIAFLYFRKKYKIGTISRNMFIGLVLFFLTFLIFQYLEPGTALKRWEKAQKELTAKELHQVPQFYCEKIGISPRFASGRVGLFEQGLRYYLSENFGRKIFGNGLGTSWVTNPYGKVVHNDFLEVLLGCGLFGFTLYVSLLWKIYKVLKDLIESFKTRDEKILGCVAIFSLIMFLTAHFHGIGVAVFPLSIMALHLGATIGLRKGICKGNT